jgi:pimeloyl-ACP methyl ester carboxylesterase
MIDTLRARYERIYLAGHSLGTLLLLDELFRSDEKVAGVYLMAVPLVPQVAPTATWHAVPTALGFRARGNEGPGHAWRAAYSVQPNKNLFKYLTYAPRFIDLFKKIIKVRRGLLTYKGGDYPVLAVQSYYDELVMRSSGRYLKRCECIRVETLRHSRHFYYPDGDLDLLRDYFGEIVGCEMKKEN